MNNFNKSAYRSITVSHKATGEERTFYVPKDGSHIIAAARKTPSGLHRKAKVQKISPVKNSRGYFYKAFGFQSHPDENGKQQNHTQYVHRLVWAAWNNDGIMPPNGGEMQVDHVDGDTYNNHPSNLELVTRGENVRRGKERKRQAQDAYRVECYITSDLVDGMEEDILSPAMTFASLEAAEAACEDMTLWDMLRDEVGEDIAWTIKEVA